MTVQQEESRRYTYVDYYEWDDGKRWELIDGVSHAMSPSPSRRHQEVIGELFLQLRSFLKGKPCKVYVAPFDVRLNPDDEDDTVVQPDLTIVCDKAKLDDRGCKGAPDMVVEVLSPSSAKHDRITKLNRYQRAGVREYWIVDADAKCIQVYIPENGRYFVEAYDDSGAAEVSVLPGCQIDLREVFSQE